MHAGSPTRSQLPVAAVVAAVAALLALACASPPPPDPGLAYREEGEAALAVGDPETAVAAYQLALAVVPGDPRALDGLLAAQVANGEGEAALETVSRIEKLGAGPANPCPALSLTTRSRLGRGTAAEAEETARRARAEACPGAAAELAEVLAARAAAEADAGETSRAIDHYREAIEVDPTAVSNFVAAGSLLLAEGQTDAAVALLADGLERHPDDRALRNLMVAALTIR